MSTATSFTTTNTPTLKIANDMEDTDFPEYGRQCELKEPWRGYRRGTIVGRNGYRYIIELSSGARIELYDDEIEFD